MRPIKFRQPRLNDKGHFIDWFYWGFIDDGFISPLRFDVENYQYVCPDKNGKDVFADALVWFHWMGKKVKAKIAKSDYFTHLVSHTGKEERGLPRTLCKFDIQHIELIEEKAE